MKANTAKSVWSSIPFLLTLTMLALTSLSCGGGGGSGGDAATAASGTGSVAFKLVLDDRRGSQDAQAPYRAVAAEQTDEQLECNEQIVTLEAEVLDENDDLLAEGGPWDCEDHQGTIDGVRAGDNRIVVVSAYDDEGKNTYKGESESVQVIAGEMADAGTIKVVGVYAVLGAVADREKTLEDTPVTIDVVGNDPQRYFNETGGYFGTIDPTTVTIVAKPEHGDAAAQPDGTITYTPASNWNGTDTFTYTVQDDYGTISLEGSVEVVVEPVNDKPKAEDVPADNPWTTPEEKPLVKRLIASDVDGDPLTYVIVDAPSHGELKTDKLPDIEYVPAADYCNSDSFRFKVSDGTEYSNTATVHISIICENDPPVAFDIPEQTPVTLVEDSTGVSILLTATDADGDPLTFMVVSPPSHGAISGIPPNLTYTPDPNYFGDDSFNFMANDGKLDSNVAVVHIKVAPVDDFPEAVDDDRTVMEDDSATVFDVLSNDIDIDGGPKSIASLTQPAGGTVVNNGTDLTYTPKPDFCTPGSQTDRFTYRLTPGDSQAEVRVRVTCINDAPEAVDDSGEGFATDEDTAFTTASVLTNDIDPDPLDTLSVSAVDATSLKGAAITNLDNGTFSYDPTGSAELNALPAEESTTDAFEYTLTDGTASDTATVTVTITGVNDPPQLDQGIEDQQAFAEELFTFTIPANAFEEVDQGDTLSFSATQEDGSPLPPWLTFAGDTFSGTPTLDDFGPVSIEVTATDDHGATVLTTFTLTVEYRDSDQDKVPDFWEILYKLDPDNPEDADWDLDEDGLTSLEEYENREKYGNWTDPTNSDTDADCLIDGDEVNLTQSNPTLADTDSDGFLDGQETGFGSNPDDENSTPEICDGLDNDLDTLIDEDVCDLRPDHKGNEFIFAFLPTFIDDPFDPSNPQLSLMITSDFQAVVTVEYPLGTLLQTVTVSPDNPQVVSIPHQASTTWDILEPVNNAVRVSASEEVSVVLRNVKFAIRDQALALPVEVLGNEYIIISRPAGVTDGSEFVVVATQNDTTVSIDDAGEPTVLSLNYGEGVLYASSSDVTGITVSANRPIAVVNGNKCANVPADVKYCEHLFEMAVPTDRWGTEFVAGNLPRASTGTPRRTYYRVVASEADTSITLNGEVIATLDVAGDWIEVARERSDPANHVAANHPIFIVQYMNSACNEFPDSESCDNPAIQPPVEEYGDASMTNLVATGQFPRAVTFAIPSGTNWLNIVASMDDVQCSRVLLDGIPMDPAEFVQFAFPAQDYGYASIPVDPGVHTLRSAQGHTLTSVWLGWHSATTNPLGIEF